MNTTCEDNWDGWDPVLEEDGKWDCDHPAFFPYGDVPTVSHSEAIANKKKSKK